MEIQKTVNTVTKSSRNMIDYCYLNYSLLRLHLTIYTINPLSHEFTSDFFQLPHINFCNTYKAPGILVNK